MVWSHRCIKKLLRLWRRLELTSDSAFLGGQLDLLWFDLGPAQMAEHLIATFYVKFNLENQQGARWHNLQAVQHSLPFCIVAWLLSNRQNLIQPGKGIGNLTKSTLFQYFQFLFGILVSSDLKHFCDDFNWFTNHNYYTNVFSHSVYLSRPISFLFIPYYLSNIYVTSTFLGFHLAANCFYCFHRSEPMLCWKILQPWNVYFDSVKYWLS